jgi:hypothetical protein
MTVVQIIFGDNDAAQRAKAAGRPGGHPAPGGEVPSLHVSVIGLKTTPVVRPRSWPSRLGIVDALSAVKAECKCVRNAPAPFSHPRRNCRSPGGVGRADTEESRDFSVETARDHPREGERAWTKVTGADLAARGVSASTGSVRSVVVDIGFAPFSRGDSA